MDQKVTNEDLLGNKFGEEYSLIMTDYSFENRLKAFDSNLKLMFDQRKKRWTILEWARDNSGWRILMTCEDDFGNPMPVGDWVFGHLKWMQDQYTQKLKGSDGFYDDLVAKADEYKVKKDKELSEEAQYRVRTDIHQWRKAFANHKKHTSHIDRGISFQYNPKPKDKGIIYDSHD